MLKFKEITRERKNTKIGGEVGFFRSKFHKLLFLLPSGFF
jgi:hypothetical protein